MLTLWTSWPGFRMMELFGLEESRYSSLSGVSMVPGTFNSFPCYHLHSQAVLAQPTRCSFLPPPSPHLTAWTKLLCCSDL